MKWLFFFPLFIALTQCNSQEVLQISYTTSTRGFSKEIEITNKKMVIKRLSGGASTEIMTTDPPDWDRLLKYIEVVDIKSIDRLPRPSSASHYDGAASAALVIRTKDTVYQSISFDEGNPPETLKPLVMYLESFLSENKKSK